MQIPMINLSIEIVCAVLCLLAILQLALGPRYDRHERIGLLLIFLIIFLITANSMAGNMMKHRQGEQWHGRLLFCSYCEHLFSGVLPLVAYSYFLDVIAPGKRRGGTWAAVIALTAAYVLLLSLSQAYGWFYTIDVQNRYHRAKMHALQFIPSLAILTINLIQLVKERRKLSRREQIAFLIFLLIPLAARITQYFVLDLHITIYALTAAAMVLYVFIITDRAEQYRKAEQTATDLKIQLMMNQIKPHFIYNTLTSIYMLCREDPDRALNVIDQFTTYLQANFNGLSSKEPIPFLEELNHTRAYLAVEEMRFEDRLRVEYDIKDTIFNIPALTLQPIVENAVKHGVAKRDGQERILIRTRELETAHEVVVEDDGTGFNLSILDETGHVGLQNVRDRLRMQCGGQLEVISHPGVGTSVIISLPKKHQNSHDGSTGKRQRKIGA